MDLLDAPTLIQTLQEKRKEIVIGSASVIAGVAILIGYFQSGPDATSYAQAEEAYSKWEASPLDDGLYVDLMEAVRKVPALGKKYEASIAQNLLNTEKLEDALDMANRSIHRVSEEAPLHAEFARTSLLIEQGVYQKAFENSVALKEKLSKEAPNSILYAHNLLRIACLQQELNNRPGEKAAWEEVESFLKSDGNSFLSEFAEYIAERKKSL